MADVRVGNRSMDRRGGSKMESGTCNVCSAPCSSCNHLNAGFTVSKSDESSDESCLGVVASQCSVNEDDLLHSSRVNAPGSLQNAASEASNLVNSNRDTFAENAESKNIIRSSEISDDSEAVAMSSKELKHQDRNTAGQGKVEEKSGSDNNKDKGNVLIEASTHSEQNRMVGKSGESIINKADEASTSTLPESESDDSEMLELDVKVCDICGDAGREDLLAICSRCSDGAEHTYCMREMLEEVPEGDWLCEECQFSEEAEKQKLEAKGKRETEATLNAHISSKRSADKFEASDPKRQAVEAPSGSPKKSVLPRMAALSRETSFKGVDNTTRKLAHHSSFNSHSSDDTESTRSTDSHHQSPKGPFFRSNSLNSSSSRPKARPVDDVILPKQKSGKEYASLDRKEGPSRNVGKSMSTRCIDVGRPGCNESIVKMTTKGFDQIEIKGSKQLKNRGTLANHSASSVDQKLMSRSKSSISHVNNHRRNRLEDIVASVGDASSNERFSTNDQISSQAKRKDELSATSCLAEAKLDGLPWPRESTDISTREDINKGNRLRAAVDAALRKKPSFGKTRGVEQSEVPPVSNVDSSCDKALEKLPSKTPAIRDWPVGLQGVHQNSRTTSDPYKHTVAATGRQFPLSGANASLASSRPVDFEVHLPSVKPVMRDWPVVPPTVLSKTSAIPEHEYIWQGDLEVQKSRNLSAMHSGLQAYLSTLASPKVVEVVNQFPIKVTLNEVPRLSTWPAQFQDIGAKEDHVALFFFAKDIESYEKNYKPLVDNMIKKDLALKGSLEGVELLIFASNQLPEKCQRWNMLFFLWGVFRGRKENSSNPLKNTPRQPIVNHGANDEEKASSVSNVDGGAKEVDETEEGEIGVSTDLKDEKRTGPATKNSADMNQKVDLDGLNDEGLCEEPVKKKLKTGTRVENECSSSMRDTSGNESASSRKRDTNPNDEKIMKKNPDATGRIVFPLDLNAGKEDEDELVDNNNHQQLLGIDPNLELALRAKEATATTTTGVILPFMGITTTSLEEQKSSSRIKPQDQMVNEGKPNATADSDAASLSLSLSFPSMEKEPQQEQSQRPMSGHSKQNVNAPLFLFRDFPDKSS